MKRNRIEVFEVINLLKIKLNKSVKDLWRFPKIDFWL